MEKEREVAKAGERAKGWCARGARGVWCVGRERRRETGREERRAEERGKQSREAERARGWRSSRWPLRRAEEAGEGGRAEERVREEQRGVGGRERWRKRGGVR
eukprot:scaffold172907_cov30-Tisochrysis_lutea.AAC.4